MALTVEIFDCLFFSGFIRGHSGELPEGVRFMERYSKGALLAVVRQCLYSAANL